MERMWTRVGLAALSLTLLGCQPTSLRDPVTEAGGIPVALADPTVLVVGDTTYVAGTNDGTGNVPLHRSEPGTHTFSPLGDALPDPPDWARERFWEGGHFWAPSLSRLAGSYVLHFSAMHRDTPAGHPGWCIGVATSSTPEGPYTARPDPLLCHPPPIVGLGQLSTTPTNGRGAIDPQVHAWRNGRAFLHFKATDHPWQLWAVELTPDGLGLKTIGIGMVMMDAQVREWEYSARERFTILENPSMDYNRTGIAGAEYYLYYSGNDWQSDAYATGIAACRSPLGPCLRVTDPPFVERRGEVTGPGGLTVARDQNGAAWAFFHGWTDWGGRRRVLHIEPLAYDGITPVFLQRGPKGLVAIDQPDAEQPGTVRIRALVAEPDRRDGQADYRVTIDGVEHTTGRSVAHIIELTLEEQYGRHTYCLDLVDDHRLGRFTLGCVTLDGGAQPDESAPSTTTTPPTTTTTAPTTTTTTTALPPTSLLGP